MSKQSNQKEEISVKKKGETTWGDYFCSADLEILLAGLNRLADEPVEEGWSEQYSLILMKMRGLLLLALEEQIGTPLISSWVWKGWKDADGTRWSDRTYTARNKEKREGNSDIPNVVLQQINYIPQETRKEK